MNFLTSDDVHKSADMLNNLSAQDWKLVDALFPNLLPIDEKVLDSIKRTIEIRQEEELIRIVRQENFQQRFAYLISDESAKNVSEDRAQ